MLERLNTRRSPRGLHAVLACGLAAAFLAGCATSPEERAFPSSASPSNTKAVSTLVATARSDAAAGRLSNAAASMERAIRLEPRNARLWHELAMVRFKQGEFAQAEQMAMRSNALIERDASLRAQNWQLVAQSREARGDTAGARSAVELSKQIRH